MLGRQNICFYLSPHWYQSHQDHHLDHAELPDRPEGPFSAQIQPQQLEPKAFLSFSDDISVL